MASEPLIPDARLVGPGASAYSSQRVRPLPFDESRIQRFESFVATFRPVFQRADQFLSFRAYLRGLLESTDRKNVESIAAAASSVIMVASNLAQSLQHFVTQSRWDHRRLISAIRKYGLGHRRDPEAIYVVHDGVFAKKGKHSVGVHRQFARSQGRKINCQIGVFVVQVGPRGYYPLGARLYLPGHWLRENDALAKRLIPDEDRLPATKAELALRLLEEIRAEGEMNRIAIEDGYRANQDFTDELTKKGYQLESSDTHQIEKATHHFEWLKADFGLDHFEGRTWHGWHHHVALVLAAYHFLANEPSPVPDFLDSSSL